MAYLEMTFNGQTVSTGDNSSPAVFLVEENSNKIVTVTFKNISTQTIDVMVIQAKKESGDDIPSGEPKLYFRKSGTSDSFNTIYTINDDIPPNGTVDVEVLIDATGVTGPAVITDTDIVPTIYLK
jgi:flagellin-like hook-associated protein FlgL